LRPTAPCSSKEELHAREGHWIREFGSLAYNKLVAGRSKVQYRTDNRGKILAKGKEYREANKDKVREWQNQWREKNLDHVKLRSKEYYKKNRSALLDYLTVTRQSTLVSVGLLSERETCPST
jgi:hypothetical protein